MKPVVRPLLLALTSFVAVLWLPAGASAQLPAIPAEVVRFSPPRSTHIYPSIDYGALREPRDDRYAKTTWRVVERTGNCCETFLTTTQDGRLLDFGGSYIHYSDDRGRTWHRVKPLTPLVNGEGAIVAAPGGDVLGVEWDPYTGDHLQSYKFEADTGEWLYTEMPLHQPFYDREWIAVVPGPVTIEGQTYEYISFIRGGWPSKETGWFMSTDGLHYVPIPTRSMQRHGMKVQPLEVAKRSFNNWVQPNTNGGMTPVGNGDLLAAPETTTSEWGLFDGKTATWWSYRFPGREKPQGLFQVDSGGRIHNVIPSSDGTSFNYRVSDDGGRTFMEHDVELPDYHVIEEIDFRANRAVGVAAVAIHAHDMASGNDQDLVFKLDIAGSCARLMRVYEVGLGNVDASAGVGNDIRFDFDSVAIFPDGRVAVSFMDSTTRIPATTGGTRIAPAIAIEEGTRLGGRVVYEEEVPPELGAPYASYTWEQSNEGWQTAGFPTTWTRSSPGTTSGENDADDVSFGIEGPAQYVDNMNATLTSPPIQTEAGLAVLQFWLRMDIEEGFDYVRAEWSDDGDNWLPIAQFSGRNAAYPRWNKITLGFESPGGNVQVRFRFTSDELCSALNPACGELTGARVDQVVVGKQAA